MSKYKGLLEVTYLSGSCKDWAKATFYVDDSFSISWNKYQPIFEAFENFKLIELRYCSRARLTDSAITIPENIICESCLPLCEPQTE